MEYRQRRLIAAAVLVISLVVVAYLIFFTPSETRVSLSTLTPSDAASTRVTESASTSTSIPGSPSPTE